MQDAQAKVKMLEADMQDVWAIVWELKGNIGELRNILRAQKDEDNQHLSPRFRTIVICPRDTLAVLHRFIAFTGR